MRTNAVSHNPSSAWIAFAFLLPNRAISGLAKRGLVVGLVSCLGACQSGVVTGGAAAGGSSAGGAGGSIENRDASGDTGLFITLPEAGTGDDAAQTCVETDAGSCCGNGILDKGEQCDDGNAVGGDGWQLPVHHRVQLRVFGRRSSVRLHRTLR